MAGATPVIYEVAPNCSMKFLLFTCTLDGSAKMDFSAYTTTVLVQAWDATNPGATIETVTAVTDGGDVTFTNNNNAIVGWAFVTE